MCIGYHNYTDTIQTLFSLPPSSSLLPHHTPSFPIDYRILENLTLRFRSPSVLDLKVGTRQHGDDAPPHKVVKHIHTCAISTSSSLGVRMGGMQVYKG